MREDKKVYETPIFSLYKTMLRPPQQHSALPFYILHAPEWINVMALTPQKEIVLVEQYRAGIHQPTLEIPGGMADRGENPEETARRELLEETGFSSRRWTHLGTVSSNPAIMTNHTHLFLAEECTKAELQNTDASEDIAVHTLPVADFLKLVKNGVVHHALVVAAVTHLMMHFSGDEFIQDLFS